MTISINQSICQFNCNLDCKSNDCVKKYINGLNRPNEWLHIGLTIRSMLYLTAAPQGRGQYNFRMLIYIIINKSQIMCNYSELQWRLSLILLTCFYVTIKLKCSIIACKWSCHCSPSFFPRPMFISLWAREIKYSLRAHKQFEENNLCILPLPWTSTVTPPPLYLVQWRGSHDHSCM